MKRPCRICPSSFEPFMSFGKMPLANGFLLPEQFSEEFFFELSVGFCEDCSMVQLLEQPDRERMFHETYPFFSGSSDRMAAHFREFAGLVMDRYLAGEDPLIVEIGSNDGTLLHHFFRDGIRHLGVEPAGIAAERAMGQGLQVMTRFFGREAACEIAEGAGQADVLVAANVMCHIADLHSVLDGVRRLLKPHGVFLFEDPYLGDILRQTAYDQIYDEHVFYFSVHSICDAMARHGLEVVEAWPQNVHGGSMRYLIAHKGSRPVAASVAETLAKEEALGLGRPETYEGFRRRVEESRDRLNEILWELKNEGKRVIGYAATSKSTTVTNYCGVTPELVEFICDTTALKQGKCSPGTHIPVRPPEDFRAPYPDYALLFGWNHREEIMAKESSFAQAGGKWIVYVPEVRLL